MLCEIIAHTLDLADLFLVKAYASVITYFRIRLCASIGICV